MADMPCLFCIAGAPAFRAWDIHVRQKLHVKAHGACTVTDRAAQLTGVVGEGRRLPAAVFGILCPGIDLAQLVVDIGIGGHRRADVDANGRGVNELDMRDPLRRHRFDVVGERFPRGERFERRDQTFQDQRRLARTGYAGHDCQPTLGNVDLQGLYRVQRAGGQMDRPEGKKLLCRRLRAQGYGFPGEKRPDAGRRVLRDLGDRPLRDDPAAR